MVNYRVHIKKKLRNSVSINYFPKRIRKQKLITMNTETMGKLHNDYDIEKNVQELYIFNFTL